MDPHMENTKESRTLSVVSQDHGPKGPGAGETDPL